MATTLKTPGEILDHCAEQQPDEIVINTVGLDGSDDAVTRKVLSQRSDEIAQALIERGVGPGVFVPIHLPTCTGFWWQPWVFSKRVARRCP
jgi:non-ribosomal peptide synthetase component F